MEEETHKTKAPRSHESQSIALSKAKDRELGCGTVVECLPSMSLALGSVPHPGKTIAIEKPNIRNEQLESAGFFRFVLFLLFLQGFRASRD